MRLLAMKSWCVPKESVMVLFEPFVVIEEEVLHDKLEFGLDYCVHFCNMTIMRQLSN